MSLGWDLVECDKTCRPENDTEEGRRLIHSCLEAGGPGAGRAMRRSIKVSKEAEGGGATYRQEPLLCFSQGGVGKAG